MPMKTDLNWGEMERSRGVYNFDVVDAFVTALRSFELGWIAIAGPANPVSSRLRLELPHTRIPRNTYTQLPRVWVAAL